MVVRRLLLDELRLPLAAAKVTPKLHRVNGDALVVRGRRRYDSTTAVYAPSFDLELRPTLRQLAGHALLPDAFVLRAGRVLGDASVDEFEVAGVREQERATRTALFAASGVLGLPARTEGKGVLVGRVADGGPADGRLAAGDVVTAAAGDDVATVEALFATLVRIGEGIEVDLEVSRGQRTPGDGGTETVSVQPDWSAGRPSLGIVVETHRLTVQLPIDITVDLAAGTAGPSAGLAIALGVVDALRPAPLSGRSAVAATGTVDAAGRVGPVGGVAMKAKAVAAHPAARVFVVPEANADEARQAAPPSIEVIAVSTLEETLDALA